MAQPVVLDLETQHTFREVSNDLRKLKISLAGLYDYATDQYLSFTEGELSKLFPYLENSSAIIGFNIVDFDLPVLAPYYVGQTLKFVTNEFIEYTDSQNLVNQLENTLLKFSKR